MTVEDNMTLQSEIFEQPERLASLLDQQRQTVIDIAKAIQSRPIQYAFLAARGTSDNAGRYANYLWGAHNGIPLALATPSLFTYYQSPPRLEGALVIGVSQSGQSPDIVSVLEEGRKQGCLALAITNEPDSPLAKAADLVLDVQAGVRKLSPPRRSRTHGDRRAPGALNNSEEQRRNWPPFPATKPALTSRSQMAQTRYMSRCGAGSIQYDCF
jgi:glucosamine--fructose-6-phosphate aminotransferase (isomerizing)